ncbi:MAG: OmpA family protein [Bacteroidales bacterium]
MKNKSVLAVFILFFLLETSAQVSDSGVTDYRKWSVEGSVGFHRPYNNFSQGYYSATPDFFMGEFGARYMFNEYFGMKLGLMYNRFTEADASLGTFSTDQYGFGLRGVANLGRILRFEEWTRSFNVLAHYGLGISMMNYENVAATDWVGNGIGGITLQAKVSPRVTLYGDITGMENFSQDHTFDGGPANYGNLPVVYKGSFGVSVSLGGSDNSEHADWYVRDLSIYGTPEYDTLDYRITEVESGVKDVNNKYDELDERVNELADRIDELDNEVASVASREVVDADAIMSQLIDDGYFNIFFNFDSAQYGMIAAGTINILKTYLENNPDVEVDLYGYADERGPDGYNQKLSQRRADAVANALINVGIDASRLNSEGRGEDLSINSTSPDAYQMARRVTFSVR